MDPIELIKNDHREVENLFEEYEAIDETNIAAKQETAERIFAALELHAEMEESLAYPRFEAAFAAEDDKGVEKAYAEHDAVKDVIGELKGLMPDEEEFDEFDAKMQVLKEEVTHHVEEEESELLPMAEERLNEEDLERLGSEMEAFKRENQIIVGD
jgi:hemerythrin-like domain-containing protein